MKVSVKEVIAEVVAQKLAQFAVEALIEEVRLTPKPGLVDCNNNGTHHDLTLALMEKSAQSLETCFHEMALAAYRKQPSPDLRARLAAIGRYGEEQMLEATGNVNTHKGAIWALGLLTGAASVLLSQPTGEISAEDILRTAGSIASYTDRYMPVQYTHGTEVRKLYQVRSAREEAAAGFPSLRDTAIPAWENFRGESPEIRNLNVLLSLMSVVDDTCILHRSDLTVLSEIQQQAGSILSKGGLGRGANWQAYHVLDTYITTHWVSPGGSADLLAATIFIQKITQHFKINS